MSRIGKKPITVPPGVKVAVEEATVKVEGPKGKLFQSIPAGLSVTMDTNVLTVERSSEHRSVRALHGLIRSLLANMVHGVKEGFERKLDIVGIGYRAQIQGKNLQLALGVLPSRDLSAAGRCAGRGGQAGVDHAEGCGQGAPGAARGRVAQPEKAGSRTRAKASSMPRSTFGAR